MVGRRRGPVAAVVTIGLAATLAVGCGGDSKTKTITVPVEQGDSVEVWQQRALGEGQKVCTGAKPPERVVFAFAKADKETEVAADAEKQGVPMSAPCSAYGTQAPESSGPTTTAKP